jgi:hypothetical protein
MVSQKVEEFVTKATEKALPDAAPEDRLRIVTGLIDVVRPTLDEIMEYSPNTARVVHAARKGAAKKAAAKKAPSRKAVKKATVGKAVKKMAAKKTAHKRMG